jgi:hypothetical protein
MYRRMLEFVREKWNPVFPKRQTKIIDPIAGSHTFPVDWSLVMQLQRLLSLLAVATFSAPGVMAADEAQDDKAQDKAKRPIIQSNRWGRGLVGSGRPIAADRAAGSAEIYSIVRHRPERLYFLWRNSA